MMLTLNILAALIALSAIDGPVRGLEARHQDNVVLVQRGDGSSTRGSSARGNSSRGTTMSADRPRRNADGVDCHRDVRTHRIRGEWVRHRHVGEDCAVRVVRQAESVLPD
jgi:hypothetical protein